MCASIHPSLWRRLKEKFSRYRTVWKEKRFFEMYGDSRTSEDEKKAIMDVSQKVMNTFSPRHSLTETPEEREQREQESLQYLLKNIRARKRKRTTGYVVGVVAMAAFVTAGWTVMGRHRTRTYLVYMPVQDSSVVLKDKSTVHLQAGTRLSVPEDFSEKNRYVKLEGEAFFEVRKHLHGLFTVDLDGLMAIVHGTSFNVLNTPGVEVKQVSVSEGSVEVVDVQQAKSYGILTRGKEINYYTSSGEGYIRETDPDHISEWRSKGFYMENGTLDEFRAKLLRSFGKLLVVSPHALPAHIEAHIDIGGTIATPELVMETFCSVYGLQYQITETTIKVWRKNMSEAERDESQSEQ